MLVDQVSDRVPIGRQCGDQVAELPRQIDVDRHALAEQLRGERLGGAAQLRPVHRHRSRRRLDCRVAVPVTATRPSIRHGGGALIAGTSEEHVDLGLHRSLDDQPGAEAGDVLDDLRQVTLSVEQGVDLAPDPVRGRYSC